jgi:long-chain acyl-CoA synthetase
MQKPIDHKNDIGAAAEVENGARSAGLESVSTLPDLLAWRIERTPSAEAYRHFDRESLAWRSTSWQAFGEEVRRWRKALARENLAKGECIAILMPNGLAHIAMDQAALARGLVPVPMHALDNPESISYILRDSGAALLLLNSAEQWRAIVKSGDPGLSLRRVVYAEGETADFAADSRLITLERWLAAAPNAPDSERDLDIRPGDLAAIVYTSGTTGRPKGVMLSHENVVANVKAVAKRFPASQGDVFLSFLPLSHTFERTAGYYFPIAMGACVAYSRSVKQLPDDLKQVRPTVLISVPRIYERFYARIMEARGKRNIVQRMIFDAAIAVGGRRFDARQQRESASLLDQLAWPLLQRTVAAPVLAELGGRLRVALSGGAPIGAEVIRLFLSLGLDILQGYGMTESSPVVAVNTPDENDYHSVGRPLDGVEIRLGENDELLVKGANVMMGYWHRPDDTARVKQADGWLHTGDQARIADGRIFITGRIKDIIVTSTGEKIAPGDLETAILADPLFAQAMVIGENRPYLAVLAVLDPEAWEREKRGLADNACADFLRKRIAQAVKAFPAYATPRAVWWTTDPWTTDNGLLTPTLKNKRNNIQARFAAEIARLYPHR